MRGWGKRGAGAAGGNGARRGDCKAPHRLLASTRSFATLLVRSLSCFSMSATRRLFSAAKAAFWEAGEGERSAGTGGLRGRGGFEAKDARRPRWAPLRCGLGGLPGTRMTAGGRLCAGRCGEGHIGRELRWAERRRLRTFSSISRVIASFSAAGRQKEKSHKPVLVGDHRMG